MKTKVLHAYAITHLLYKGEVGQVKDIYVSAYTKTEAIKILTDWYTNIKKVRVEDVQVIRCFAKKNKTTIDRMSLQDYYDKSKKLIYGEAKDD